MKHDAANHQNTAINIFKKENGSNQDVVVTWRPSLPMMPTPTSAAWIMATSLAPSPMPSILPLKRRCCRFSHLWMPLDPPSAFFICTTHAQMTTEPHRDPSWASRGSWGVLNTCSRVLPSMTSSPTLPTVLMMSWVGFFFLKRVQVARHPGQATKQAGLALGGRVRGPCSFGHPPGLAHLQKKAIKTYADVLASLANEQGVRVADELAADGDVDGCLLLVTGDHPHLSTRQPKTGCAVQRQSNKPCKVRPPFGGHIGCDEPRSGNAKPDADDADGAVRAAGNHAHAAPLTAELHHVQNVKGGFMAQHAQRDALHGAAQKLKTKLAAALHESYLIRRRSLHGKPGSRHGVMRRNNSQQKLQAVSHVAAVMD
ncbi:MAG: hypothetical protein FRX49_02242 [Trebouxia sp. A1-2]|nr:MAG: hypothetical protein FRX49_02242 [Trebouxia sp. A1-2]